MSFRRFVPKGATDAELIAALSADLADAEKLEQELYGRIYSLQRRPGLGGIREILKRWLGELDLAIESELTPDERAKLKRRGK